MKWRIKSIDASIQGAQRSSLRRSIGLGQLILLGVGSTIGTGIFVLTAIGIGRAGPALLLSFVIAAFICGLAALAYAELSAMIPISGSAYSYTYAALGEFLAWLVGWNLILEYTVAAAAVSVGWSGYALGLCKSLGVELPSYLSTGLYVGKDGGANLLAIVLVAVMTTLLVIGTRASARVNATLVMVKLSVLLLIIAVALPRIHLGNFVPFMPFGFVSTEVNGVPRGVMAATALIFFAYLGFDTVSTAAEETRNPNRTVPLAIVSALGICTVLYVLVAASMVGTTPYQRLAGNAEPLAAVLRNLGYPTLANLVAIAAVVALPSVLLVLLYGQSRIFFAMSRDGLLPAAFSRVHRKLGTPHIVTMATGSVVAVLAGLFSVGEIAELSNTGTLFAFIAVSVAVMWLRYSERQRQRPFRCPALWIVGPLAVLGCTCLLISLASSALIRFGIWTAIGALVYFCFGYWRSPLREDGKQQDGHGRAVTRAQAP